MIHKIHLTNYLTTKSTDLRNTVLLKTNSICQKLSAHWYMKKTLILFILFYAVVFYFINEKHLAFANPGSFVKPKTEGLQLMNVRNERQGETQSDTGFSNNSNQPSDRYFFNKKDNRTPSKTHTALVVN